MIHIEQAIWAYYGNAVDQNDIDPDSAEAAAIERIMAICAGNDEAKMCAQSPALRRGIEMIRLGQEGKSISLQNDERSALLLAINAFGQSRDER